MPLATAVLVLAIGWWAGPEPQASANGWGALLHADIEVMHGTLLENHPGPVDDQNSAFRDWLEGGRRQALERARTCNSFEGYRFALEAYARGFKDGHLGVSSKLWRGGARWPGFAIGRRDGRFRVVSIDERAAAGSVPPVGTELLSCDGIEPRRLLERDVFPFTGNPDLEREWDQAAPQLLVDERNPWRAPVPKSCLFLETGLDSAPGKAVRNQRPLTWRQTDWDTLGPHLDVARERRTMDFAIRRFGERGIWVTLPSFNSKNERILAPLKQAIAEAPAWRDRDPIVFDVRTNGGGNSSWGTQILEALYGREYLEARLAPLEPKTYVEWRVSPHNLAHVEWLAERSARERGAAGIDAESRRGIDSFREALAAGRLLWRQPKDPPPSGSGNAGRAAARSPVAGKVFLLTDGSCGSACLDFADMVRALPTARHVGRTTFADSVYMESAYVPLPSGIAELGFAVKVYRNRPRGNNQPYVPHHRFAGDISDSPALERWILQLAESHAAR
jgi:hypothetical protein